MSVGGTARCLSPPLTGRSHLAFYTSIKHMPRCNTLHRWSHTHIRRLNDTNEERKRKKKKIESRIKFTNLSMGKEGKKWRKTEEIWPGLHSRTLMCLSIFYERERVRNISTHIDRVCWTWDNITKLASITQTHTHIAPMCADIWPRDRRGKRKREDIVNTHQECFISKIILQHCILGGCWGEKETKRISMQCKITLKHLR